MRMSTWIAFGVSFVFVLSALGMATAQSVPAPGAPAGASAAEPSTGSSVPAPHPDPIPVSGAPPQLVVSHWWAGSALSTSAANVSAGQVSVQITIPAANISAETRQFYYVLLSVWDNAGSYDQIGLSNTFGSWGFTYSYTTYCASGYYYDPDYFTLAPGATYTFTMAFSAGTLYYYVYQGETFIGGLSAATGGTAFDVSSFYSCDNLTYYDFTDYEEVYYTHQVAPDFSFLFTGTQVDGKAPSLGKFETPGTPSRVHLTVSRTLTAIDNELFEMLYTGTSSGLVYLPAGTTTYHFSVEAARLFGTSYLSSCPATTTGWSISGWAGTPSPSFTTTETLHLSPSAAPGTYLEYLSAYDSRSGDPGCSGESTFVTLEVVLT